MNDLVAQLHDSIAIVRENKQLKAENELLRAKLRIADLKMQRRMDTELAEVIDERSHATPALLRRQAE